MKELSIEEKAKAYDEAIEKFGTILNLDIVKESGTIFADDVRKILPELAESEDERMSKYLIKYFEANKDELSKGFKWNGITVEECIAWLEKQGEYDKIVEKAKSEKQRVLLTETNGNAGIDWDTRSLADTKMLLEYGLDFINKKLEKQGEQKPNYCHHEVDLFGCSEEYRKAYYDGWNNCNMQHSQCKTESDAVVKCLINGMKFYYEDNEEATWGTDKWSMPVKHIIEVLEKYGSQNLANSCKTCKDEQKPVWKPSDEQMKQLGWIAKQNKDNMIGKELMTLYNDLKKVREE